MYLARRILKGEERRAKYISDSSTFVYHAVALLNITELDNNVSAHQVL